MSLLKLSIKSKKGFTIPELLITMVILGIVLAMAIPIITQTFRNYFSLQYESEQFTSIASQSQRIANVIRGLSDINTAEANSLDVYAYFYPNDAYVSEVKYYLSGDQTILYADVTPMTANPPDGTLITSEKKTYTIIDNFKKASGVDLFAYLDEDNEELDLPISDTDDIKSITVNLAVPKEQASDSKQQSNSLTVNLRNRKTNL